MQEETKVLVYLDAHLLQDGENFTAFLPESFMEGVREEAAETGGWWFRKCIPADKWAAGYYNVSPSVTHTHAHTHTTVQILSRKLFIALGALLRHCDRAAEIGTCWVLQCELLCTRILSQAHQRLDVAGSYHSINMKCMGRSVGACEEKIRFRQERFELDRSPWLSNQECVAHTHTHTRVCTYF